MTLKECLAAARAEKLVALPESVSPDGEAVEGVEEQNRTENTAVGEGSANIYPRNIEDCGSDSEIYPKKPDDSCDQSEIYPRSTRIYPCTPVKLVQSDIFFGDAQGDPKKICAHIERVGPLGEIRVDRGVLRVDRAKSLGEIGEIWPKTEGSVVETPVERPRKPFLSAAGDLSIPFGSDPRYHWWNGGQSVKETIAELKAELELAAADNSPAGMATSASEPGQVVGVSGVKSEPGG